MISEFGENDFVLQTRVVDTPLTSPLLICQLARHEIMRNMEGCDSMAVIRRILSIVDPNNAHWRYEHDQSHRIEQYKEGIKRIKQRLECINRLQLIDTESESLEHEKKRLLETMEKYKLICTFARPHVRGTLHPHGNALSSAEGADLFDGWRLRGIYVRIAGPKKATKAGAWKRSAGSISINSICHVNGEERHVQVPSRTGTYGLTVRLVWGMWSDMLSHRTVFGDGVRRYSVVDGHNRFVMTAC